MRVSCAAAAAGARRSSTAASGRRARSADAERMKEKLMEDGRAWRRRRNRRGARAPRGDRAAGPCGKLHRPSEPNKEMPRLPGPGLGAAEDRGNRTKDFPAPPGIDPPMRIMVTAGR